LEVTLPAEVHSRCLHWLLRNTSPASPNGVYGLPLRTEVQAIKGSGLWQNARFKQNSSTGKTGILIIHAPSETMDLCKDYFQRHRMLAIPCVTPLGGLGLASPALPIDNSAEGCDTTGDKVRMV